MNRSLIILSFILTAAQKKGHRNGGLLYLKNFRYQGIGRPKRPPPGAIAAAFQLAQRYKFRLIPAHLLTSSESSNADPGAIATGIRLADRLNVEIDHSSGSNL